MLGRARLHALATLSIETSLALLAGTVAGTQQAVLLAVRAPLVVLVGKESTWTLFHAATRTSVEVVLALLAIVGVETSLAASPTGQTLQFSPIGAIRAAEHTSTAIEQVGECALHAFGAEGVD